jgi:hypothetical protein
MIFLSHTYTDKPVVEPIAVALREIYGQDKVFYDAWSIRPGDGIIDKMNAGLQSPEFVFFFVSENSLKSAMVSLEWQNALMKATKNQCQLIPVRIDGTPMPPILRQNLYIDMFSIGVEAAKDKVIEVVKGNAAFARQHENFSNLTWTASGDPAVKLFVKVAASHVMEPRPIFALTFANTTGDLRLWISGAPGVRSWPDEEPTLPTGARKLIMRCAPYDAAPIVPKFPLVFEVTPTAGKVANLESVLHEVRPGVFEGIPSAA